MGTGLRRTGRVDLPTVPVTLQTAGVDGAGGAGFPAYAKWERLDEVRWLLMNHQESEPNFFIDKYLGKAAATEFAAFFESMLAEGVFEGVVIAAKEKDRETWLADLETATDATVFLPDALPIPEADRQGVIIAYTDDRYEYGMESVLLRLVADVTMGTKLPMDFGWVVQNTESLLNVIRALDDGTPVTEKYVQVDGEQVRHRFLLAPVGTPAEALLAAAGVDLDDLGELTILADGGPGWCFAIDDPAAWGLRKRTNCLLVLDREQAEANTLGDERINVLRPYLDEGVRTYEREPTRITPETVRVPLVSNPSLAGIVNPAVPVVAVGDAVETGQLIARPAETGFSTAVHASIDGVVAAVEPDHVEIHAESGMDSDDMTTPEPWSEPASETANADTAAPEEGTGGRSLFRGLRKRLRLG